MKVLSKKQILSKAIKKYPIQLRDYKDGKHIRRIDVNQLKRNQFIKDFTFFQREAKAALKAEINLTIEALKSKLVFDFEKEFPDSEIQMQCFNRNGKKQFIEGAKWARKKMEWKTRYLIIRVCERFNSK